MNGLYHLSVGKENKPTTQYVNVASRKLTMYEAHHTFGHIYYAAIKHVMKSEMVIGLDVCAKEKLHRKPFPNEASNQSTTFSKHIFVDLWGLATVLSISSA